MHLLLSCDRCTNFFNPGHLERQDIKKSDRKKYYKSITCNSFNRVIRKQIKLIVIYKTIDHPLRFSLFLEMGSSSNRTFIDQSNITLKISWSKLLKANCMYSCIKLY